MIGFRRTIQAPPFAGVSLAQPRGPLSLPKNCQHIQGAKNLPALLRPPQTPFNISCWWNFWGTPCGGFGLPIALNGYSDFGIAASNNRSEILLSTFSVETA